jgi:hypothetical protein
MTKIITLVAALVAAISMSGVATAGATSWHSNQGLTYPAGVFSGAFNANATSGTYIHLTSTFVVNCAATSSSSTLAGQLAGATGPASGSWSPAGTIALNSRCTTAGTPITLTCTQGSFSADAYNGGTATNLAGAGGKVTSGRLAVDCQLHLGNAVGPVCKNITGSVGYTYTNPISVGGSGSDPSADGTLVFPVAGQSLTAADPVGVRCAFPNGATTISAPASPTTDPVYTVQGAAQPIVWFGS